MAEWKATDTFPGRRTRRSDVRAPVASSSAPTLAIAIQRIQRDLIDVHPRKERKRCGRCGGATWPVPFRRQVVALSGLCRLIVRRSAELDDGCPEHREQKYE